SLNFKRYRLRSRPPKTQAIWFEILAGSLTAIGQNLSGLQVAPAMIRKTTLDNSTRIITEVVEGVYSASIGIWVDVGSRDEGDKNNGVSHCLEHMLFKGTSKRTAKDIAQEIEDVGGSL